MILDRISRSFELSSLRGSGAPLAALLVSALFWAPTSPAAAESSGALAPVVIVVFDELPTVSLLDSKGAVDPKRFPAFAELSQQSTWARSASTVSTRILEGIPALLTGRLPTPERRLSIRNEFPDNLLTWLAKTHQLHALEPQSMLRPGSETAEQQAAWLNSRRKDSTRLPDQGIAFRRAIAGVGSEGGDQSRSRPPFHFIHVALPQAPWHHAASGRVVRPARLGGNFAEIWSDDPGWAEDAQRRHLIELTFADALLGELIARLHETHLYDQSLLVVTAAYGAGFWPGESRRTAGETDHPEDVLLVPMFVKAPNQTTAKVVTDLVQSIDLAPTVADVLGQELPWPVDGCSILDSSCVRADERSVYRSSHSAQSRGIVSYPATLSADGDSLTRKLALFGESSDLTASWPKDGFDHLRGRPVADLDVALAGVGELRPNRQVRHWPVGRGGVRFEGKLVLTEGSTEPGFVAFALNGRLEAIVRPVRDRANRLAVVAMLPEASLDASQNTLDAYVIDLVPDGSEKAKLVPLAWRVR